MSEEQTQLPMQCALDITTALEEHGEEMIRAKWEETLVEYVDVLISNNRREGMSESQAKKHAYSNIAALCEYRGGKNEYLPRGKRLKAALKNMQIWDLFYNNKMDVAQLAEAYNQTEIGIYAILKEQRALHSQKLQPDLFAEET